jgi:uncharacterized protein (TIGR02246 family)
MRRIALLAAILASAGAITWAAQPSDTGAGRATPAAQDDPSRPIRDQASAFEQAWNAHDAGALAAMWTDAGDLINPFGRVAAGRNEVLALVREEHEGALKNLKTAVSVKKVRVIGDTALSDWSITLTPKSGETSALMPWPIKHHCFVVSRKSADGTWRFEAVRPYQFAAAPKEFDPAPGEATPPAPAPAHEPEK